MFLFLRTSSHFHQSITPILLRCIFSTIVIQLDHLLSQWYDPLRLHPTPRLTRLIIVSVAPKTSSSRPHSSQRTHSSPLRSCQRTQHNPNHRVRNPRSLLPLCHCRETAHPPFLIPPPRPYGPRCPPLPVRSKRPSRSSRPR